MTRLERARAAAGALMPLVVFVMLVVIIGLAILVQSNDDNIDDLDDSVASLRHSTERVEQFVDDLEDQTPDEAARSEAITRAVELVPAIKDILCGEFPEAAACQGG